MPKEKKKKKFFCRHCEYETSRYSNFQRHRVSELHNKMSFLSTNVNSTVDDNEKGPLEHCNKPTATTHPSVPEHQIFSQSSGRESQLRNSLHINLSESTTDDETNLPSYEQHADPKTEWFPFSTKAEMLLYVLMNSKTHPVSDEVVKYVMFILKELGIKEIPALSSLKQLKFGDFSWEDLMEKGYGENNVSFWNIKPSEILKLSIAHPKIATTFVRYPTKNMDVISHPSSAAKWHTELEFESVSWNDRIYTIGKVYHFDTDLGRCHGILSKFIDNLQIDVIEAELDVLHPLQNNDHISSRCFKITNEKLSVPVINIVLETNQENISLYKEVDGSLKILPETEKQKYFRHAKSDMPVVNMPVNLFVDDTSANKSKRWLPLHCVQMQIAGTTLEDRHRHDTIHYLGASEKVDVMTLCAAIVKDIQECNRDGIVSFDAQSKSTCTVKPDLDIVIADFNMLSLCCNHMGASANKFCPRCHADADHFSIIAGTRTPAKTKRTIQRIALRSTESRKKDLRKATGVKEHPNCFWDVIDPHRDIPVGLLYLLPLGLIKHFIQILAKEIDERTKNNLTHHLLHYIPQKSMTDFFQYIDSRQGKDFKEYLQIAPFNLAYVKLPQHYIQMACCLAKIQKILNKQDYSETDIERLEYDIHEYHQLVTSHFPALKKKVKTHMLLHVVEDIKRHGPPLAYNEDSFEKNHGVIRKLLFNENQKARSRDTAVKFAKTTLLHHVLTGGYIKVDDVWQQSSSLVQAVADTKEVASFLGTVNPDTKETTLPVLTKLRRQNNRHTDSEVAPEEITRLMAESNCCMSEKVTISNAIRLSHDVINIGDWIVYMNQNEESYGIFERGYKENTNGFIEITCATSPDIEETVLGCPVVKKTDSKMIVPLHQVKRKCSIVHDCRGGACQVKTVIRAGTNEQEKIMTSGLALCHNLGHNVYIVNTYKL